MGEFFIISKSDEIDVIFYLNENNAKKDIFLVVRVF